MKRFIIFRADRLGDFLIISNIINKIKLKYLDSHITIVCSPLNEKLVKNYSIVNKVIVYNRTSSIFEKFLIIKKICKYNYYASLTLDGKTFSHLANVLLKSQYKYGISYKFNLVKCLNIYWSKPNYIYNKFFFNHYLFFTSKNFLKKAEHLPTLFIKLVSKLNLKLKKKDPYYFEVKKKDKLEYLKLYNNKIKGNFFLINLDEKWNDIKDINYNLFSEISLLQRKLKKKIIITTYKNNFAYYKNLKKKVKENKHIIIFENLKLGLFERLISHSSISISCHSGFLVQIAGFNKTTLIDIINKKDYIWYSSWKPLNTKHKFVFKSNFKKNSLKYIFNRIIIESKKF